jgi:hypothetical protein
VLVDGVPRQVALDARGGFRLDSLPEGRRALTLAHPRLDSLGVPALTRWVTVLDADTVDVALATPSEASIRRAACGESEGTNPIVMGVVTDSVTGQPVPGAIVRVRWEPRRTRGKVEDDVLWRETYASPDGSYRLCRLERALGSSGLKLWARVPMGAADGTTWLTTRAAADEAPPPHAAVVRPSPRGIHATPLRVGRE